jgi:prepilin peptidase CpaA
MPTIIVLLLLSVFPVLIIVAALRDITSYTIPNWISLALICAFLPAALAVGLSWPAVGLHLAVGVVALLLGMLLFALGWIGGGDAKLFAAGALWFGWPVSLSFALLTCVAGGLLAFSLLTLRSSPLQSLSAGGPAWLCRLVTRGESVPYGVAIAAGALLAFPETDLMRAVPRLF